MMQARSTYTSDTRSRLEQALPLLAKDAEALAEDAQDPREDGATVLARADALLTLAHEIKAHARQWVADEERWEKARKDDHYYDDEYEETS